MASKQIYLPFVMNDIPDPGSRAFRLPCSPNAVEGFVVRRGQEVYAYYNQCPHTGVTLNWQEHLFLDSNDEFIQCAMHGALFSVEDGRCLRGPCVGERLEQLDIKITARGQMMIDLISKSPYKQRVIGAPGLKSSPYLPIHSTDK